MLNAREEHEKVLARENGKYEFTADWFPVIIAEHWRGDERHVWLEWLRNEAGPRFKRIDEDNDYIYWSVDLVLIKNRDVAWRFKFFYGGM